MTPGVELDRKARGCQPCRTGWRPVCWCVCKQDPRNKDVNPVEVVIGPVLAGYAHKLSNSRGAWRKSMNEVGGSPEQNLASSPKFGPHHRMDKIVAD